MAQAMLQTRSSHNVYHLQSPQMEREKIQAFAVAQNALVTALHHVRASDGNLLRAMANTRRALDAIQDMRQLIK